MRYYDKKIRCEVFEPNENTLDSTDERVAFFFEPCPYNYKIQFSEDGMPYLEELSRLSDEELELNVKINKFLSYLSSTDFYYARLAETGESVPEEIVIKRKEAREFIRENKSH